MMLMESYSKYCARRVWDKCENFRDLPKRAPESRVSDLAGISHQGGQLCTALDEN